MKQLYAKVVTFDAGFEYDKEQIRANHTLGDVFEVTLIDMGGCHTDVYEGDKYYNSVFFDFFLDAECTKPHDIYEDPDFNPYLRRSIERSKNEQRKAD